MKSQKLKSVTKGRLTNLYNKLNEYENYIDIKGGIDYVSQDILNKYDLILEQIEQLEIATK